MISMCNNSAKQTLNKYLLQYRTIFTEPSFHIFTWIITAMLCTEEIRSIKFLYDNFINKYFDKSLNCFYYLLSYSNFSCDLLLSTTVKIAISLIPEELKKFATIFLTTDDTLQSKFGKKFDCCFHLFDHTSKNGTTYLDGHCFVTIVINIPLFFGSKVRYLSVPLGYRLYDKIKTKLQLTAELIDIAMPLLQEYQVILLCDSWYPKGQVIDTVKKHSNLELIAAIRSDTALYELAPPPTGRKGRPRKYGARIKPRDLCFEKIGEYFVSTKQVLSNLFGTQPVEVTVTVKDIENLDSIRLFISTVASKDIRIFQKHEVENISYTEETFKYLPYFIYSLRWNIEVIFYQHKFFWSFGNYMVRNKLAIERYVNLIAISFSFVQIIPFLNDKFSEYKFQSPQTTKHAISDQISRELILETFVKHLESNKIYSTVKDAVKAYLGIDSAA